MQRQDPRRPARRSGEPAAGAPTTAGRRDPAAVVATVAGLAVLWWVLSEGAPASWLVGIPAVLAAAWAFLRLSNNAGPRISPRGVLGFVPFFLAASLRGGMDVFGRVMSPRLRIRPDIFPYPLTLRTDTARTLFLACVSLVPGTLSVRLEGDTLQVHALALDADPRTELVALERAIGRIFPTAEDTP